MKALLMKDLYVVNKQLRLYLLILVVFIAFNRDFGSIFLPVWCSMLPYTSIAYDEQSKWDTLAGMMPYSIRDLVLSKYVFGWICVAAVTAIMAVIQLALALAGVSGGPDFLMILIGLCTSASVMAVSLPAIFRFGVERGRMFMFLFIFLVCGAAGAASFVTEELPASIAAVKFLLPAVPLVLTAVSVPLSMKFYARRRR